MKYNPKQNGCIFIGSRGTGCPIIRTDNLNSVTNYVHMNNIKTVAIDEGQFFTDIQDFAENMANSNREVIVTSLNSNYNVKHLKTFVDFLVSVTP